MKLADYSQVVTVDQLDAALRAGAFEGVFHYLGDDFALREEDPDVVTGIRARGWPQAGIFVPTLGAVNGPADVSRARAYGFPPGTRLYLDIEPVEFDAAAAAWPAAADGWCERIRAGGYSPGIYGVDRTVAACADRADTIWRAVPGECDPAGPGLAAAFMAGARIVQCGAGTFAGVSMDVSYSQFTIGGNMTPDEHAWLQWLYTAFSAATEVDPQGNKIAVPIQMTYAWAFIRANTAEILGDLRQLVADLQVAPAGTALTAAQIQLLQDTHDAVARMEQGLKSA